jgi:tubulin delta
MHCILYIVILLFMFRLLCVYCLQAHMLRKYCVIHIHLLSCSIMSFGHTQMARSLFSITMHSYHYPICTMYVCIAVVRFVCILVLNIRIVFLSAYTFFVYIPPPPPSPPSLPLWPPSNSQSSDCMMYSQNDSAQTICKQLLNIKNPSFQSLNRVIASQLASILLPSWESTRKRQFNPLLDGVSHLCAHPGYKLSSVRTVPQVPSKSKSFSVLSWKFVTSHLFQMQLTDGFMQERLNWQIKLPQSASSDEKAATRNTSNRQPHLTTSGSKGRFIGDPFAGLSAQKSTDGPKVPTDTDKPSINRAVAATIISRGLNVTESDIKDKFSQSGLFADWSVEPVKYAHHGMPYNDDERSACVWSTSQSIVKPLDHVLSSANEMFQAKAYLHHYTKYDVSLDNHFIQLEQVLSNYKQIH